MDAPAAISLLKKASLVYELGWLKSWRASSFNERRRWVRAADELPDNAWYCPHHPKEILETKGECPECEQPLINVRDRCLAFSYICDDGFESYCYDICGYHQMSKETDFHREMIDAATNPIHGRRRMVLASRGSFKTVILVVAYATWLMAREYVVTSECNIRIGIQGETLALPQSRIRTCRDMMESEQFVRFFGNHRPRARGPQSKWGDDEAFSAHRKKSHIDATLFSIALGAERTGSHPDLIITDDLQAAGTASTPQMLEKVWRLFRLNPALILKPVVSDYSENVVIGTRWDPNDVYNRIIKDNERRRGAVKYAIFIKPICKPDMTPLVPDVWDQDAIHEMYDEMGPLEFARQVLLNPTAEFERVFKESGLQYWDAATIRDVVARGWVVVSADMAWYDRDKAVEKDEPDHTVIHALLFTPENRIYVLEEFRDQCSKAEAIEEMYRLYYRYGAVKTGLQKYDEKYMYRDFEDAEIDRGKSINVEFVSDSNPGKKRDRIAGGLEKLWNANKIYINPGNEGLTNAFLEFPRPPEWDRLDSLCTGRLVGLRPQVRKEPTKESLMDKHIQSIKDGTGLIWPDGERADPPSRRRGRRRPLRST